jgi:hypothetical protein
MLTALPVRAAAAIRSVWRERNAGNLQDVDDLGGGRGLRGIVNVGQQRQSCASANVRENAEAGVETRARNDRMDVRLALSYDALKITGCHTERPSHGSPRPFPGRAPRSR